MALICCWGPPRLQRWGGYRTQTSSQGSGAQSHPLPPSTLLILWGLLDCFHPVRRSGEALFLLHFVREIQSLSTFCDTDGQGTLIPWARHFLGPLLTPSVALECDFPHRGPLPAGGQGAWLCLSCREWLFGSEREHLPSHPGFYRNKAASCSPSVQD